MSADSSPDPHGTVETTGHGHGTVDTPHVQHEKPEDWGWHKEFPLGRQIAGWACVVILGLYLTGWHYNHTGTVTIIVLMILLAGGLLFDRKRQRTQWRR
jgi:Protein of unknown function (DUF2631)